MKNRDKPAGTTEGFTQPQTKEYIFPSSGLTKREYTAIAAMQGLMANPEIHYSNASGIAVQVADSLFDELEKDQ